MLIILSILLLVLYVLENTVAKSWLPQDHLKFQAQEQECKKNLPALLITREKLHPQKIHLQFKFRHIYFKHKMFWTLSRAKS